MRIILTTLLVSMLGCASESGPIVEDDLALIGKCAFSDSGDGASVVIDRGMVFVYAFRDADDGLFVATGVANVDGDELIDPMRHQVVDQVLFARLGPATRLEFGNLGIDRTGEAEHFIAKNDYSGEVFTGIGSTYGTNDAYPMCAFYSQ